MTDNLENMNDKSVADTTQPASKIPEWPNRFNLHKFVNPDHPDQIHPDLLAEENEQALNEYYRLEQLVDEQNRIGRAALRRQRIAYLHLSPPERGM